MGTILQEMGHDSTIHSFINDIIAEDYQDIFYLVTPAMGPKRDIYYFEDSKQEWVSAWSESKDDYIPEFYYRQDIEQQDMDRLTEESDYKQQEWYQNLKDKLGGAPEEILEPKCKGMEEELGSELPDIIGFDYDCNILLFAEVKFEGFSKKARDEVLNENSLLGNQPYYLTIPTNPIHASAPTDTWLDDNLPENFNIFKFDINKTNVLPKQTEVKFNSVNR